MTYLVTGRATPREVAAMRRAERRSDFWSNIDKNDPSGCHVWTGDTRRNSLNGRDDGKAGTYRYGYFDHPACVSRIAQRVLAFSLLGKELPTNLDITPTCRNHLCCNPEHLLVAPEGKLEKKLREGIPLRLYCERTH